MSDGRVPRDRPVTGGPPASPVPAGVLVGVVAGCAVLGAFVGKKVGAAVGALVGFLAVFAVDRIGARWKGPPRPGGDAFTEEVHRPARPAVLPPQTMRSRPAVQRIEQLVRELDRAPAGV